MKKYEQSVYLAGAITCFYNAKTPELATEWRKQAEYKLKSYEVNCFNPCDEPKECWKYPSDGVIKQNYYYLKNSDIVLVNLDMINDSPGTIWELSMAWEKHIPVIAFGNTPWLNRPHIKSLIDVHFDTLDEAVTYIKKMYCLKNYESCSEIFC